MVHLKNIENKSRLADYINEFKKSGDLALEEAKLKIVNQIVEAMNFEGVNNAELARRLNKSRAYITQILQGDVNFTTESLVRIATVLDCDMEFQLVQRSSTNTWLDSYMKIQEDNIDEETDENTGNYKLSSMQLLAS